ncbi:MAG: NAD-binding protein [Halobacteriales archaeon]
MPSDAGDAPGESALEVLFYHTERIRFVYWRQFSGAKPTVGLVGIVAIVAFITGLSNLSQPTVAMEGPVAAVVDVPEGLVRIWGVVFSFLLGGLVVGLNRRKRVVWYVTVAVLPLAGLLPLVTLQVTDVLLLSLVAVALPLLVINRNQFDQKVELSPIQIAALSSIVGVLAYGTIGSYVMREQYIGIENWTDALYYVIVTIATVGYGDATPLTQETKLFTLSFIVIGTGAFTAAIGSLLIPAIESRMAAAVGNMTPSELRLLEDHVLVLGYGELTDPILEELHDEVDLVVVTPDTEAASMLRDRGLSVLTEDPTEKETLLDARIDVARGVVVATEDDAEDVLAIIAVKQTNPDIFIVAAASDRHHVDKLEDVGADEVISPTVIGGRMIGQSVIERARSPPETGDDAG